MKIAAILTVFNRKEKTLHCLQCLYAALASYQSSEQAKGAISLSVFLTDDGCTDGTSEALRETFPEEDIRILQGDGNLFWAGGMRLAWQAAIDEGTDWDYFLLLNNDTYVYANLFDELLKADDYGKQLKGVGGLSSGITCEVGDKDNITYGGFNFVNKTKGRHVTVKPTGTPQEVDLVSGNILLVNKKVVETIGIFYKGFRHDLADHDYNMTANRHNFPVMVTANVCGECEFDHASNENEIQQLKKMTLAERKKYLSSPTHSDHDYLLLVRRNLPLRYPMTLLLRTIRLYCPSFYHRITQFRGVYKDSK
ncbi:MAG: glycosyltransferase family 2 protein [Prevotella sp.]|nr:glycosyltransferase family 2 protein [Prevotella sp.]